MSEGKIGIISNCMKGDALGYHFAVKGYEVKILELRETTKESRLNALLSEQRIKLKKISGDLVHLAVEEITIQWIRELHELEGSDLLIVAVSDDSPDKLEWIAAAEEISGHAPILVETMRLLPGQFAQVMKDASKLIAAYFFDVEYANNNVELVSHPATSVQCMDYVRQYLIKAGFSAYSIKECLGFIHNRVGGIGISNLFRLYDEGVLCFSELSKYIIVTRVRPPHMITVQMAQEMKTEMPELLPLFSLMRQEYGDRFYSPALGGQPYTPENLHEVIASVSIPAYVTADSSTPLPEQVRSFNVVYISGAKSIYNNMLFQLMKRADRIYFDSNCASYLTSLESHNQKMYQKLSGAFASGTPQHVDLVIDLTIEHKPDKIRRLHQMQEQFGPDVPILVMSPVHRIGDLAEMSLFPSMVFGIYTQRLYLTNTEMVIHPWMDSTVYSQIKNYISSFTRTVIEVRDSEVRPLALLLLSKMLEALRVLDEGIADRETIEALGVDDGIFQDISSIGSNDLQLICEIMQPAYESIFTLPAGVLRNLEQVCL